MKVLGDHTMWPISNNGWISGMDFKIPRSIHTKKGTRTVILKRVFIDVDFIDASIVSVEIGRRHQPSLS